MTRTMRFACALLVALGLALFGARAVAADALDPVHAAQAARTQAEDQLSQTRQRIIAERSELSRQLAGAYEHLESARAASLAAKRARAASEDALRAIRATAGRDAQAQRSSVTQLFSAAHRDPPAGIPDARILATAVDGIASRLTDLPGCLSCRFGSEDILDRNGRPTRAPVLRIGRAAAVAYGADTGTAGLLIATTSGRPMVSGPALAAAARISADDIARGGMISVPLDLDGSIARARLSEGRGFGEWFASGGFFMWPILATAVAGMMILCERGWWFWRARTPPRVAAALDLLIVGDFAGARAAIAAPRAPAERVLVAGLAVVGREREARDAAVERALLAEEGGLERGLGLLAALAACAPLLGLLGTVTGMIGMFATIAEHGSGNPRLLSGNISVALVTTQFGLIAAVPLLIAHALIARVVERRGGELEEVAAAVAGRASSAPTTPAPTRYDTELEKIAP